MPAQAPGPSIFSRIAAAAARFPGRAAFVSPDGTLTYAALMARAEALAGFLAAAPPGPVLVYGHKEPALPVAFLACARAGHPYVPADASLPAERVSRIARVSGARLCLAARPLPELLAARLRQAGVTALTLHPVGGDASTAVGKGTLSLPPPVPATDGERTAYVIFTSGSTGDPKGVPIPWRALSHFTDWLLAQQAPEPGQEVVLNQAPFSFDLSVMDFYLALLSGGTLFAVTAEMVSAPRTLFGALATSGVSMWVSTPSFARFCLAEPRFTRTLLPRLRRFIFCGETLPPATVRALAERFPDATLWNTYGPTETTVAVTSMPIDPQRARSGAPLPVGAPAPGMRVLVLAPDLRPLPDGQTGEIVISGPQVSPGYLAAGVESGAAPPPNDRFTVLPADQGGDRAYRTGDAGHITDGLLYCDGRLDRQIKLHGYRLELEEIEAHLRALPGVADAAVLAVLQGGIPEYLVAFAVLAEPLVADTAGRTCQVDPTAQACDPGAAFERAQALRQALGRTLPAYALPRVIRFIPALPLTANGKVDRTRLEALLV